ncbi:16S rRNA (uracil(1498)-N(3))-methyltransferase [Nocardioides panacisoli]|uniref:16S rRNA (uracil(1498)-N(3))-methyltransferase n=1 Tax=Nocardioides panacisoli TaxID=627624 RepID=UPI001C62F54D|nr:16S rRNA (uracil(1498)-N(3))-methyltransferase [Nocardioides panacisoli]QYJ04653.1 16S rRNA (uracil(1498)-N(3))-methyltransferase [Nocardioides panacisoli]
MTLPQHLVDSLADAVRGGVVTVEGEEAHHAVVVRRLRTGESVRLGDGRGRYAVGEVVATTKRSFDVAVHEVHDVAEPTPRITVVQALPKGDRGELSVEVLTEVGVATVVPWAAARSVAVWKGERATKSHRKWQATAREAAKQARRAWAPEVTPLATTSEVVDRLAGADLAVVLHENADTAIAALPEPAGDVVVVVGPEGGLAPEELDAFTRAGATPVRMGVEVQRTSTAGLSAVAALLSRTERWR